uniref:Uncharacterized protein n=1 Tax=Populus alba TaxID=43335 RepID=A0A4U5PQB7_POPAL|nr:hypothetical protein D5086_0000195770 [Populus alba]
MAPAESEEADEQGQVEFQEVSPEYTIFSGSDSSSQPAMASTVKEKLEYIKKILSIGALEELVPTTPKKRLHVSSSTNAENAYIFDELPSPPKKRLYIFSSNKAANECIFEVSSPLLFQPHLSRAFRALEINLSSKARGHDPVHGRRYIADFEEIEVVISIVLHKIYWCGPFPLGIKISFPCFLSFVTGGYGLRFCDPDPSS